MSNRVESAPLGLCKPAHSIADCAGQRAPVDSLPLGPSHGIFVPPTMPAGRRGSPAFAARSNSQGFGQPGGILAPTKCCGASPAFHTPWQASQVKATGWPSSPRTAPNGIRQISRKIGTTPAHREICVCHSGQFGAKRATTAYPRSLPGRVKGRRCADEMLRRIAEGARPGSASGSAKATGWPSSPRTAPNGIRQISRCWGWAEWSCRSISASRPSGSSTFSATPGPKLVFVAGQKEQIERFYQLRPRLGRRGTCDRGVRR